MDLVATFLDTLDLLFDIPGSVQTTLATRPSPMTSAAGDAPAETGPAA